MVQAQRHDRGGNVAQRIAPAFHPVTPGRRRLAYPFDFPLVLGAVHAAHEMLGAFVGGVAERVAPLDRDTGRAGQRKGAGHSACTLRSSSRDATSAGASSTSPARWLTDSG